MELKITSNAPVWFANLCQVAIEATASNKINELMKEFLKAQAENDSLLTIQFYRFFRYDGTQKYSIELSLFVENTYYHFDSDNGEISSRTR
jgi:hypothetical protein